MPTLEVLPDPDTPGTFLAGFRGAGEQEGLLLGRIIEVLVASDWFAPAQHHDTKGRYFAFRLGWQLVPDLAGQSTEQVTHSLTALLAREWEAEQTAIMLSS